MRSSIGLMGVLGGMLVLAALAPAQEKKPKKRVLVITESRGFVHDVVRRGKNGELCLVERTLIDLGKKSGDFEVVCSQNSRQAITKENLKDFDAVFFYTSGTLPLSDTQKADLISFVKSGKGFAGSHSATDTFYDWPEYGKLIGGYFNGHPWHQKVRVVVEDTKHPATKHLGESFEITDEIYQFRAPYDRKRLRVLMRLARSVDRTRISLNGKALGEKDRLELTVKDGKPAARLNGGDPVEVKAFSFEGPRGARKDGDNALAWVQEYGKGKVFYTALGHRSEVWKDERFQKHVLGGLRYVLGLEAGDARPRPPIEKLVDKLIEKK
jgi:type 1 glutamine amidotransferase